MTKTLILISALLSLAVSAFCQCDSTNFDRENFVPEFADGISNKEEFYDLTAEKNRELWFAEIENPKSTKFTKYWDSYHQNNYQNSQEGFVRHYQESKEALMAFQLDPNILNMSSYDIFVIQPWEHCYLISRTYMSHGRINEKSYSIVNEDTVIELQELFERNLKEVTELDKLLHERQDLNTLFLVSNLKDEIYWTNVFKENVEPDEDGFVPLNEPDPKIEELFQFLSSQIKWTESY